MKTYEITLYKISEILRKGEAIIPLNTECIKFKLKIKENTDDGDGNYFENED